MVITAIGLRCCSASLRPTLCPWPRLTRARRNTVPKWYVVAQRKQLDVMPFTYMPEIVAQDIFRNLTKSFFCSWRKSFDNACSVRI